VFAFCFVQINNVAIYLIHTIFIVLVVGGTIYTMGIYYLDTNALQEQYQYAKVLPTILDNDHIRFSWCVVIALILLLYQHSEINSKRLQRINYVIGLWLFIFLHILGSKTGLLMCYIGVLIYLFYQFKKAKKILLIGIAIILLVAPIIAYNSIPTFKKRIDYIKYDFSFYKKGQHKNGLSDGMRIASIKAGWSIATKSTFTGVGYGDVQEETNKWYDVNMQLETYEKILPSSQLLIVYTAVGVFGLLIFLFSIAYPLWQKQLRKNVFFILFYVTALFSFIFEIPLEGQYGVFIFGFFSCWFMYLAKIDKVENNARN
jgi:O-antigen ligase